MSGVLSPISIENVERLGCGADIRIQINGDSGEVLHHGRARRRFSRAQRRALITTAGGCQWPGCTAPPSWCDVHHAAWYRRDEGPTDVENGVLLCSFHHHLVHDPTCRWRILVHSGFPHLVPRGWRGTPEPSHRMQRHVSSLLQRPADDLWGRPRRQ